ncbi:DUF3306 domain-containing protein [Cupriavidus pampae]|uniref:DUF3306 domain-containing protein n=1 Tax=Cupriavidus pampae TaxID=659251 RepID=A0ABM8WJB9_9BURK|nr:DUF3306 domain-containing protein [Cupriavidus pampae]CAG9167247.1 hypothetical protein LMG32289_01342 [Cupriavidus pampae]
MSDSSFLSRWSRRKTAVREGATVPDEPAAPAPVPLAQSPIAVAPETPAVTEAPADLPTMADVALLQPGDNVARFVARGVDESVKRAALRTLFADPHFNVMDGLDTYIDDYGKPDPIPPDILRRLRQSETLKLFDVEESAETNETMEAVALPEPLVQTAAIPDATQDDASKPERTGQDGGTTPG